MASPKDEIFHAALEHLNEEVTDLPETAFSGLSHSNLTVLGIAVVLAKYDATEGKTITNFFNTKRPVV